MAIAATGMLVRPLCPHRTLGNPFKMRLPQEHPEAREKTVSMDDQEFVRRIREKIERSTGCAIELHVDDQDPGQLQVEFNREVPQVMVGANILQYSGFARMCVEYAVASIRQQRPIDLLEFHLLLARN